VEREGFRYLKNAGMTEVAFLQKNADKWERFEKLMRAPDEADPDRLAELFVHVTDDLSYARTFFPEGRTTRYLNDLAGEAHRALYRNRREGRSRLLTFWTQEVPRAVYAARREMQLALVVFLGAMGVGLLSAAADPGFTRLIMGDAYVNMTLANIEQGDPMAVYKQMPPLDMFLALAWNNVRVALLAFAAGLAVSVGTIFVLFQNGVMVGAFEYFLHAQGVLAAALPVVYLHGALELSAIVIAGGAGLAMGNAILFPGTYPRGESFRRGARRGLKIVIGLVPVIVAAALIEGFATRHTEWPLALRLALIGLSFGFVGGYFVWYPWRLARRDARRDTQRGSQSHAEHQAAAGRFSPSHNPTEHDAD
jgi:uncharacterized membrane protein SpoIIM required for sporulation